MVLADQQQPVPFHPRSTKLLCLAQAFDNCFDAARAEGRDEDTCIPLVSMSTSLFTRVAALAFLAPRQRLALASPQQVLQAQFSTNGHRAASQSANTLRSYDELTCNRLLACLCLQPGVLLQFDKFRWVVDARSGRPISTVMPAAGYAVAPAAYGFGCAHQCSSDPAAQQMGGGCAA